MPHRMGRSSEMDHTNGGERRMNSNSSVTCYTNSIASCIHVNTTKLRNITCTLVATCVIVHSLECIQQLCGCFCKFSLCRCTSISCEFLCRYIFTILRATSHMTLRARDHCTSSTLTGGKGGAGPSSLQSSHYTWGTNGVCLWMQDGWQSLHEFIHGIEWIMFHGHLDYFPRPPLGGRPNTNNHWETLALRTLTTVGLFYFIMCEDQHE